MVSIPRLLRRTLNKGYDGDILYMDHMMNGFDGFAINHYPDSKFLKLSLIILSLFFW